MEHITDITMSEEEDLLNEKHNEVLSKNDADKQCDKNKKRNATTKANSNTFSMQSIQKAALDFAAKMNSNANTENSAGSSSTISANKPNTTFVGAGSSSTTNVSNSVYVTGAGLPSTIPVNKPNTTFAGAGSPSTVNVIKTNAMNAPAIAGPSGKSVAKKAIGNAIGSATQSTQATNLKPSNSKFNVAGKPGNKNLSSTQKSTSTNATQAGNLFSVNANTGGNTANSQDNRGPNANERQAVDKARKKQKRGGRKYQEQKKRKATFDAQRSSLQNTTFSPILTDSNTPVASKQNPGDKVDEPNAATHQMQQVHRSTPQKRGRITGGTPPELSQAQKKGRTTTSVQSRIQTTKPSMADVVIDANLTVAIVDMPVDGVIVPMHKAKYDTLYQTITAFILQSLDSSTTIPTFGENRLTKGVMKIVCSTPAAKAWLTSAVQYFPAMWNEMKLKVVDFDKLPQPKKVLGLFQNCNLDDISIKKLLNAMNANVSADRWSIMSRSTSDNGTHIVFGMSAEQLEILKACGFRLHFGAGIAKFKDISKKNSNDVAQSEVESDMDTDGDEELEVTTVPNTDITVVDKTPHVAKEVSEVQENLHTAQSDIETDKAADNGAADVVPMVTDAGDGHGTG